jgi:hypothetical protein
VGLLTFIKEAGEKLFGKGNAQAAMTQAQADPAVQDRQAALRRRQQVSSDLRGQQTDVEEPGSDLPGPDATNPTAVMAARDR